MKEDEVLSGHRECDGSRGAQVMRAQKLWTPEGGDRGRRTGRTHVLQG